MTKTVREFGCWPSPISAEFVAGKALRFQTLQSLDERLYWSELRPHEEGRAVIVGLDLTISGARSPSGAIDGGAIDFLPAPFSAQTKVHEYGGNAYLVTTNLIYFVNGKDQQIWTVENQPITQQTAPPEKLTDAPGWRFADLVMDEARGLLICVAENHNGEGKHPENLLVSICLEGEQAGHVSPLVQGDDFYASPCLSPDGKKLACISWNLPDMPWEGAQLHLGRMDDHQTFIPIPLPDPFPAGAFFQPQWDRKGNLWFVNDQSGFGQLARYDGGSEVKTFPLAGAEFALPLWNFGLKTCAMRADGRMACAILEQGKAGLVLIDPASDTPVSRIPGNRAAIDQLVPIGNKLAAIISHPLRPDTIALIDPDGGTEKGGRDVALKSGSSMDIAPENISSARKLTFKNKAGQPVYGNYYPPCNTDFKGPPGHPPPVIVTAHGGPTTFSHTGFKPKTQFWTSRGFGYFDINYSGSWGFGKDYRQRLDGQWGVLEVEELEAGARFLVESGLADPSRLAITGSSASGYTVLMALVNCVLFAAGVSSYGISDMARLHAGTHKFEAGYTISLLALTPQNEEQVLAERSPLHQADKISSPVIFFQGLKDKVVPPEQAELMVQALQENGIETRYQTFEDEGHGFRNSQNIKTALNMEYQFYKDILAL